jgi:DNA polymerase-4
VERLADPKLNGKPVIVGGTPDSRGVVCSASYEARRYGVHAGMASARARVLCPQGIFLPLKGPYRDYSRRVEAILQRHAAVVEMASVDEAYLDLTDPHGWHEDASCIAGRIRAEVREELGLPISVGVGTSRMVAKIASGCAKPDGLKVIQPGQEEGFLGSRPLRKIPGVGGKLLERLNGLGIETVEQLRVVGLPVLQRLLGVDGGISMLLRLHGLDLSPVGRSRDQQRCSRERTFADDVSCRQTLHDVLVGLSARLAMDLREMGARTDSIALKLRDSDFSTRSVSVRLASPTNLDAPLRRAAGEAFDGFWRGQPLRLLGLAANRLLFRHWQPDLFPVEAPGSSAYSPHRNQENPVNLARAIDKVRQRYGFRALIPASGAEMRQGSEAGRARLCEILPP